jgi:hypothetical protein
MTTVGSRSIFEQMTGLNPSEKRDNHSRVAPASDKPDEALTGHDHRRSRRARQ